LPRVRGEGWGEGIFFELGQERFQNSLQISQDVVVLDTDHVITENG